MSTNKKDANLRKSPLPKMHEQRDLLKDMMLINNSYQNEAVSKPLVFSMLRLAQQPYIPTHYVGTLENRPNSTVIE